MLFGSVRPGCVIGALCIRNAMPSRPASDGPESAVDHRLPELLPQQQDDAGRHPASHRDHQQRPESPARTQAPIRRGRHRQSGYVSPAYSLSKEPTQF